MPGTGPEHLLQPPWPAAASETLAGTLEYPCVAQLSELLVTAVEEQKFHQWHCLTPDYSADLPGLLGQELAGTLQDIGPCLRMPNLDAVLARRHLVAAVCITQGTDSTQCSSACHDKR